MAFIPTFGTGWEMGSIYNSWGCGNVSAAANPHTGTYSLRAGIGSTNKWWEVRDVPAADIYVGCWIAPGRFDVYGARLGFRIGDSLNWVDLRPEASGPGYVWSAYINSVKVGTGTAILLVNEWHHLQVYLHVADVGGRILTRVDGADEINYTGDTNPASGPTILGVRLYAYDGGITWVSGDYDDLIIGYSDEAAENDWPGDYRFDGLFIEADSAVQWTPVGAANNWDCVDERPPSGADYVETLVNDHKDKYALSNWDPTEKVVQFLTTWVYARKGDAAASQIKIVLDDGVEDVGVGNSLLTTYRYIKRMDMTKPSGGAWDVVSINALLAGIQAEIV